MKNLLYYVKLAFVLLVIGGVAAGILAYVNTKTAPIIEQNQKKGEVEARKAVLPEATRFEADSIAVEVKTVDDPLKLAAGGGGVFRFYRCYNDADQFVGYTFIAYGPGYSSTVQTMVGVTPQLKVNKTSTIYQSETPGLGAKCADADFADKFTGLMHNQLKVDKDGGQIKSITGATITTRAVTNSIANGLKNLPAPPVEQPIMADSTATNLQGGE